MTPRTHCDGPMKLCVDRYLYSGKPQAEPKIIQFAVAADLSFGKGERLTAIRTTRATRIIKKRNIDMLILKFLSKILVHNLFVLSPKWRQVGKYGLDIWIVGDLTLIIELKMFDIVQKSISVKSHIHWIRIITKGFFVKALIWIIATTNRRFFWLSVNPTKILFIELAAAHSIVYSPKRILNQGELNIIKTQNI